MPRIARAREAGLGGDTMTRRTEGQFDHFLLARGYPIEVARLRSYLARSRDLGVALAELFILHDVDGRCCKVQPWPETMAELLQQLPPSLRKGSF